MRIKTSILSFIAVLALFPASALAADTATIEQKSDKGIIGSWTLVGPNDRNVQGSGESKVVENLEEGNHTLLVRSPEGAVPTITIFLNGEVAQTLTVGQANFKMVPGDDWKFVIEYAFVQTGVVSAHSDPPGVGFTVIGPNGFSYRGVTPWTWEGAPHGQYSVTYDTLEGCAPIATQSKRLEDDERAFFEVQIFCETADRMREEQEAEEQEEVEEENPPITIDPAMRDKFTDVQQSAWFAESVYAVASLGYMTGYVDAQGEETGTFGPGNSVTLAELAKIAHRIGNVDEKAYAVPLFHKEVVGTWSEPFVTSAEHRGWIAFVNPAVNLDRPATRGEVLVTLLQAMDVPLRWQKGGVFRDVTTLTVYAAAIETAAADGIVAGRTNAAGLVTGEFGPADPVTRAEMAKILVRAVQVYGR